MEPQYIYIVQASNENTRCKIGITKDLDRRLKEYNSITGKSKDNTYQYLFSCEVSDMTQVEKDIKETFVSLRENKSREIYFYNPILFDKYVNFIKKHKCFVKEISIRTDEPKSITKIVKKITPSLDERGLSRKDLLQKAKQNKNNDEFYTRYEDIEKELSMYNKNTWKDKVVFCNCDDAVDDEKDERRTSAFALYFLNNFNKLKLKKLICTHHAGPVDLFNQGQKGYVYTYEFTRNGFKEHKDYPVGYDGSFDHQLSLRILNEEADIVCTNPPFSRAKDFWKIMIESKKRFIILSIFTNIVTTAYIPYFVNNKVWAGYNRVDWFLNPKRQTVSMPTHWYTNIPITDRPKYRLLKIVPLKEIPDKNKRFDDSKVLLVDNCYIPVDYNEPFAVSVNPILNGILEKGYKIIQEKEYYPYIKGKNKFARVLIQKTNI